MGALYQLFIIKIITLKKCLYCRGLLFVVLEESYHRAPTMTGFIEVWLVLLKIYWFLTGFIEGWLLFKSFQILTESMTISSQKLDVRTKEFS